MRLNVIPWSSYVKYALVLMVVTIKKAAKITRMKETMGSEKAEITASNVKNIAPITDKIF